MHDLQTIVARNETRAKQMLAEVDYVSGNDNKPKFEKLVRDGKVAVLLSTGFGAGWSTWNGTAVMFDSELVEAVLAKRGPRIIAEIAERKYPGGYWAGAHTLAVAWVPQGARFMVREYDGSESLLIIGPDYGFVA